ncbi:MAG: hypothetical protein COA70_13150 [Planctomycetota bacterium]|nr:MAG: hypothetical protein COA70_13150 [Planctomycetota bacterium]
MEMPWRVVVPLGIFGVLPEVAYLHFVFWVVDDCQGLGHSRWGCWWEYLGSTPGVLLFGGGVVGFLVLMGVLFFEGRSDEGKSEEE